MTKARSLADFISDGNPLADGTIAVSEVSGAAPLADPSFTGNIAVTGNVDGRDVAADGTKLDGIETSATADQTDAEIRTAVEAATDSNVFTDADHSKLNAIEASATADQSDAEIRTAVEAATDSNVFTDADHTKLNAIEASADVTDTVNVVAALTAGSNITIAANGTIAGAAQYTHPTHAGDDAAIDTGALSGATVISDLDLNITTDTLGHVTDANATVATRNLTLANLGYTGATNANNITNNNQLTNGAGYTTYTSNQPTNTNSSVTFEQGVFNGPLYVNWNDGSSNIEMGDTDHGSRRIHCNSNRIGFLKQDGNWGSYCNDDGSWVSDSTITATAFHGDGSNLTGVGAFTDFTAGNNYTILLLEPNGTSSRTFYNSSSYTTLAYSISGGVESISTAFNRKFLLFQVLTGGTLRLTGKGSSYGTHNTLSYRFLKNGVQQGSVGTLSTANGNTFAAISRDITVSAGDWIEIQGKTNGWDGMFRDFKVLSGSASYGGAHMPYIRGPNY